MDEKNGEGRVAVIAALRGELKPLVKGWRHLRREGVDLWLGPPGGEDFLAACAGVGAGAAERAFVQAEKQGPLKAVVSAGWAGALDSPWVPGRAYLVSGVIDARGGKRYPAAPTSLAGPECWLVTSPRAADQKEKRRLGWVHGAALVDMEAVTVARLAAERGIPFHCVKGVTDGWGERIPDFNLFLGADGSFRLGALAAYALPRPASWPVLARLGIHSDRAAHGVASLVKQSFSSSFRVP